MKAIYDILLQDDVYSALIAGERVEVRLSDETVVATVVPQIQYEFMRALEGDYAHFLAERAKKREED